MNQDDVSRRVALLEQLKSLPDVRFDEVVFRTGVPAADLPGREAPRARRAMALLDHLAPLGQLDVLVQLLGPSDPSPPPAPSPPPPPPPPPPRAQGDLEREYLAWVEREFRHLPDPIVVGRESLPVPLDRVFISLRAFPGTVGEIQQVDPLDLTQEPTVWQERDRQPVFAPRAADAVSLHDAVRGHPASVILGDPGSGKTTTARWLTLSFARALAQGRARVDVRAGRLATAQDPPGSTTDLGAARLPIFAPVSEIAKELRRLDGRATLFDLLAHWTLSRTPVYADNPARKGQKLDGAELLQLFQRAVLDQRAVVFLDGLDETTDGSERKRVVELIHDFLDVHVSSQAGPGGGNQLIVTSRIVGYRDRPLREGVARFTVEKLSERAIAAFSDAWYCVLGPKLAGSGTPPDAAARRASQAFLDELNQPGRRAVRELAANPFLLSKLCLMSYENRQALPASRSRLYEQLVERALRALFVDKDEQQYTPLQAALDKVLTEVAEKIHTTSPTGMLDKASLQTAIWSAIRASPDAAAALATPDAAFDMVAKRMGLLTERGTGRYGFGHLTIQEHLVGKRLVRSPRPAELMIRRSMDPRWHEAVLLGFGFLCESETIAAEVRQQVCDDLLRGDDASVPNGAILIAKAARDRAAVPPDVVARTVEILLAACGRVNLTQAQPALVPFVERWLADLLTDANYPSEWRGAVERICTRFAASDELGRVVVVARLLYRQKLALVTCAKPLLGQLFRDSPELEWILHRAVQTIAMGGATSADRLQPVDADLVAKLSPDTCRTLRDTAAIESIDFTRGSRHATDEPVRGIPAYLMPVREAFERSPGLVDRVRGDVHRLQLVAMLYGGLGEFESQILREELSAQAAVLGAPTIDRQYHERAARYLDTALQPTFDRARKRKTTFEPAWIARDSPLTPVVERWLAGDAPAGDLVRELRALWDAPDGAAGRQLAVKFTRTAMGARMTVDQATELALSDCLIALAACGAAEPPLHDSVRHGAAAQRSVADLQRIRRSQRDPLTRLKEPLEELIARWAKGVAGDAGPALDPEAMTWSSDSGSRARQLGEIWHRVLGMRTGGEALCTTVFQRHADAILGDPAALLASLIALLDPERRGFDDTFGAPEACWWPCAGDPELGACLPLIALASLPRAFDRARLAVVLILSRVLEPEEREAALLPSALVITDETARAIALETLGLADRDRAELVALARARAAAVIASHPVAAFHGLRCLARDALGDPEWRRQLTSGAMQIRGPRLRAAALAQTAAILDLQPEAEVARDALAELIGPRDGSSAAVSGRRPEHAAPVMTAPVMTTSEAEFVRVCEALVSIGARLEIEAPTALRAIDWVRPPARTALLALYWRCLFTSSSEDLEYSLAVVLDTSGKTLHVPPDELIESFARSLVLLHEFGCDDAQFAPVTVQGAPCDEILDALMFLALAPTVFEPVKAWALAQILPHLQLVAPRYVPLAVCVASERTATLRRFALRNLARSWRALSPQACLEACLAEAELIADPVVRFYTLVMLGRRGMLGITVGDLMRAAIAVPEPAARAGVRLNMAMLCLPIDEPQAHEGFDPPPGETERDRTVQLREAIRWLAAHGGLAQSHEERAALASALAFLCTDAVLVVRGDQPKAFAAQLLLAGAGAPDVIRAMIAHDQVARAPLDEATGQIIEAALVRPAERDTLAPLLALIAASDVLQFPMLDRWRRDHTGGAVGDWAALALAERGQWNGDIVRAVIALLEHPDDLLRGRAHLAMELKTKDGTLTRGSALGEDGVRALGHALAERDRYPRATGNVLVWALDHIMIDLPGLLPRLRSEAVDTGSADALKLLGSLCYLSEACTAEMLALLESDGPVELRRALLSSVTSLWTRGWCHLPEDSPVTTRVRLGLWRDLCSRDAVVANRAVDALGRMATADDIAALLAELDDPRAEPRRLRVLAINAHHGKYPAGLLTAPERLQRLRALSSSADDEIAIAAGELLLRAGLMPEAVWRQMSDDHRFLCACVASVDGRFVDTEYLTQVRLVARGIVALAAAEVERGELAPTSLMVRVFRLADQTMDTGRICHAAHEGAHARLMNVLPICAGVAELSPDLYRRIARDYLRADYAQKLQIVATGADTFTTRQAALVLLGMLRTFSPALCDAMRSAAADAFPVQNTAIAQLDRIQDIDPDALEAFRDLLRSASANVIYAATRMLLQAIKSPRLDSHERAGLEDCARSWLQEAVQTAHPARVIALLERGESRWRPRMRIISTLRDFLARSALELDSVRLDSAAPGEDEADDVAHLRVWTTIQGERRLVDLYVGARAAESGPVQHQCAWLNAAFDAEVPHPVISALADVSGVAGKASASVAELVNTALTSDATQDRSSP